MSLDHHLGLRGLKDSYDVIGLHSASSFRPEWCECLGGYCQLWLCLDNDKAGRQGVSKVVDIYKRVSPQMSLCSLEWPRHFRDKYDMGDLLRDHSDLDIRRFCLKHCKILV
jgi:hypothetical protein